MSAVTAREVREAFTPGPWIQLPHPYPDCHAIGIGAEGDDFSAAHTTCYLNAAANARLISAAPQLVEALRDLVDDISERFDLDSPSTNPGIKSTVASARAALAAACGEVRS
jgi:hypothetical protein